MFKINGVSEFKHESSARIRRLLSSTDGPNHNRWSVGTAQGKGSALINSGVWYGLERL